MGKKPIVSLTYENERISINNSLPYLKCVLRLSCAVHGQIYGLPDWSHRLFLGLNSRYRPLLPLTSIQNNGNAEFRPRFSRWLQPGKFAEIGNLWFALGAKGSWSKVTNGKDNYRVLPRRNLETIGAVVSPIQILIFWMLRNNADARWCSYFELGLPVVYLTWSWTPK